MLEKKQKIFMLTDNKYGLRYIFLSYNNAVDASIAKAFEDIFMEAKYEIKYELLYRGLTECGYALDILAERSCMSDTNGEGLLRSQFANFFFISL